MAYSSVYSMLNHSVNYRLDRAKLASKSLMVMEAILAWQTQSNLTRIFFCKCN